MEQPLLYIEKKFRWEHIVKMKERGLPVGSIASLRSSPEGTEGSTRIEIPPKRLFPTHTRISTTTRQIHYQ